MRCQHLYEVHLRLSHSEFLGVTIGPSTVQDSPYPVEESLPFHELRLL